jgi:hypothetical protein
MTATVSSTSRSIVQLARDGKRPGVVAVRADAAVGRVGDRALPVPLQVGAGSDGGRPARDAVPVRRLPPGVDDHTATGVLDERVMAARPQRARQCGQVDAVRPAAGGERRPQLG